MVAETFIENILARMSERRMPQVVSQRERFNKVFIQAKCSGDRSGNRRNLKRVGEPGAMIIAHFAGKHLCLVAQSAERRAVDDPISIALIRSAVGMARLGMAPTC